MLKCSLFAAAISTTVLSCSAGGDLCTVRKGWSCDILRAKIMRLPITTSPIDRVKDPDRADAVMLHFRRHHDPTVMRPAHSGNLVVRSMEGSLNSACRGTIGQAGKCSQCMRATSRGRDGLWHASKTETAQSYRLKNSCTSKPSRVIKSLI